MNCKSVQSLLSAYLDRELTGTELLQFREHLHSCAECRAEETELRQLKSLFGSLSIPEPPADFADRLCANVLKAAPVAEPRFNLKKSFLTFGAVAACSMAATFFLFSPKQNAPVAKSPDKDNAQYNVMQDEAYSIGLNATEGAPVTSVSSYGR